MRWLLAIGATLALIGCLRFQTPRCLTEADCEGGSVCGPEGVCLKADPRCIFDSGVCGSTCAPCGGRCAYQGSPERVARAECIGGVLEIECKAPFLSIGKTCRPPLREETLLSDAYPGALVSTTFEDWGWDRTFRAMPLRDGTLVVAAVAGGGTELKVLLLPPDETSWITRTLSTRPDLTLDHLALVQGAEGGIHLLVAGDADPRNDESLGNLLFHYQEQQGSWQREEVPGLATDQGSWGKIVNVRAMETAGELFAVVNSTQADGSSQDANGSYNDNNVITLRLGTGGWQREIFRDDFGFPRQPSLTRDPESGEPNLFLNQQTATGEVELGWWRWDGSGWQDRTYEFPQPLLQPTRASVVLAPGLKAGCVTLGIDPTLRSRKAALWPDSDPMLRDLQVPGGHTDRSCEPIVATGGHQVHFVYGSGGPTSHTLQLDTYERETDEGSSLQLASVGSSCCPLSTFEVKGTLHIFFLDDEVPLSPLRHLWIDP